MSIHNILVPNNLTLYCENLIADQEVIINGNPVPISSYSVKTINLYYNNAIIQTLQCKFRRVEGAIPNALLDGICFIQIPSFNFPVAGVGSQFYLDISGASPYLISPTSSNTLPVTVINNSLNVFGLAHTDSVNQRIYITLLDTTDPSPPAGYANFATTGTAGLTFSIVLSYFCLEV